MAGLLVALPALGLAQESAPQAGQSGDSVSARLGRLEDKVRDLQVMVGTLESLLRAKPGTVLPQEAPPVAQDGSLGPRIDALETQITALTSHIERIGKQMSALEAKLSAAEMPPPAPPTPSVEPPPERQGEAPAPPADSATALAPPDSGDDGDTSKPRWYGPKPGGDELAALLERQAASEPQNLTAALPSGDAQTLYQQGYGALLQKDYAGAEVAFSQLVDAYPNDPLAGNAQYWLGESYYVRGQYKNAADAFLKGYKKYKSGDKAPDTLLKLGMALAELGQKDAACSTLDELKTKYPGAPEHIGDEAKAWRKKTGC
jgi:tol-pal system protein YbgF